MTSATYVLIQGAGDSGWYWHLVDATLRERGHDVVVMDLPVEDDAAGLSEYADVVVEAIDDRRDLVVVAQSFGGYIAPIVCADILHSNFRQHWIQQKRLRCCRQALPCTRRLSGHNWRTARKSRYWGLEDSATWRSSFFARWGTEFQRSLIRLRRGRLLNGWEQRT